MVIMDPTDRIVEVHSTFLLFDADGKGDVFEDGSKRSISS